MRRLIVLLLFTATAVAQTDTVPGNTPPAPSMTFEVASVRPVNMENGGILYLGWFRPLNSSHLTLANSDIRFLLVRAFSLRYYQLAGYDKISPNVRQTYYTIQAHADEDSDKRLAELPPAQRKAEQLHMLQVLLIDRFRLKFHWEDRLVLGYRLVVAKRGSKLLPAGSLPMDADGLRDRDEDGKMPVVHSHNGEFGGIHFVARGAGPADIASTVSFVMQSPVQDATGLDGKYDFDLRSLGRTAEDNARESSDIPPPMVDAVQDQLGLRLEPAQIMQKMFVVDHVEAPTPN